MQTESGSEAPIVGHRTVTEAAVHGFACLTGDYARMHLDHEFGRSTPMGVTIAHGLLNACWALGALTRYAEERLLLRDPSAWMAGFSVRFSRVAALGDTLAVRWRPSEEHAIEMVGGGARALTSTAFEVPNQRGEITSTGLVTIARGDIEGGATVDAAERPELFSVERWRQPAAPEIFYAEDLLASGPRCESPGRTVTEGDVVAFARETSELNPRMLDSTFARETPFDERMASPMLVFCLSFSEFLRTLLELPMPSSGFAGHLGDSWRFFQPVRMGDTIRTRHRALGVSPSRSRPGQAIVRFGLQVLNQRDELVQDGEVAMMISSRPSEQG